MLLTTSNVRLHSLLGFILVVGFVFFSTHHYLSKSTEASGLPWAKFLAKIDGQTVFTDLSRFESPDPWRPTEMFQAQDKPSKYYRVRPPVGSDHPMVQPIVDHSSSRAEKVFLMIKSGQDVFWNRVPVHLFTTLTQFPNFALYSDFPGSIGGHEVVDIFERLPDSITSLPDFAPYKQLKQYRQDRLFDHGKKFVEAMVEHKDNYAWILDRYKNIPMLADAYERSPNSDWYVFMDGDSYIVADGLLAVLGQFDPHQHLYAGHSCANDKYNFANGGTVVVLSQKTMSELFSKGKQNTDRLIETYGQDRTDLGDKAVALMVVDELDIRLTDIRGFNGWTVGAVRFAKHTLCDILVSFHHVTPHDVEVMWEYEQAHWAKNKRPIREGDIYLDFVRPYIIDGRKDMWDNYMDNGRTRVDGVQSAIECENLCEKDDTCLSWRYNWDESSCEVSDWLQLGKSTLIVANKGDSPRNITSGWQIDRLDEIDQTRCQLSKQTNHWNVNNV